MARYNSNSTLSITIVELAVHKELGWIFRRQPEVDVGIDGIIEEAVEKRNPTGRFLGVQVKSGESQIRRRGDHFVIAVRNIHRKYWLKSNMPIILVTVLNPEDDPTCYFVEITKQAFSQNRKNWEILIPIENKLNSQFLPKLTKILDTKGMFNPSHLGPDIHNLEETESLDFDEDIAFHQVWGLKLIIDSTKRMIRDLQDLTFRNQQQTEELKSAFEKGLSLEHPKVQAIAGTMGKILLGFGRNTQAELMTFVDNFVEGAIAWYSANLKLMNIAKRNPQLHSSLVERIKESLESISNFNIGHANAILGIDLIYNPISEGPKDIKNMQKGREVAMYALEQTKLEWEAGLALTQKIQDRFEEWISDLEGE